MPNDTRTIPLSSIRPNPVALRGVTKDTDDYRSLAASVAARGVMSNITVREKTDEVSNEKFFEIIDGLHRWSAAADSDIKELEVKVLNQNDMEVLETQIVGNLVRVETQPVQYTKQLQRMMHLNPLLTVTEVANKISSSPAWVTQRLGLLKLEPAIQKLVDEDKIVLQNAHALAKLPKEEQLAYLDAAMAQGSAEFVGNVNNRLKEIRSAQMQGRKVGAPEFSPVPHARTKAQLLVEYEKGIAGPAICAAKGLTTATDGFKAGIEWALELDADSLVAAKAAFDASVAEQAAEKLRKKSAKADADKAAAEKALAAV